MNVKCGRLVCVETKAIDVRKRGAMWHRQGERATKKGKRGSESRQGRRYFELGWTMCQVTWTQNPWFGLHPSGIYATYHEASKGRVLVTRCSGGMDRANKHRKREAMEGVH